MTYLAAFAAAFWLATPALAEDPQILAVKAEQHGASWTFDVTLAHPDTGWDHYADAWEVLAPDGTRLGIRELTHPHETEQPFTRRLTGVIIAQGTGHVMIRAHCMVDGWGVQELRVDLP